MSKGVRTAKFGVGRQTGKDAPERGAFAFTP